MKVFGYARVSTENQLDNYSIDEQEERIRAYCRAKGWLLLQIFTDGGYSGSNTDRPALQKMLALVRTGQAEAVVACKLDRLSRSQKDTLYLIEDQMLAYGADFISIQENFDTSSPLGRAMIGILSVFAQLEKDQIAERFAMGRIGRGKAGYYHGGPTAPRGYRYEGGELIPDEGQAIQIREIFRLFLDGKSIHAIGRMMEQTYGGSWNTAGIRRILGNSVYIGKVKFAGVEYPGRHPPLVCPEDFEKARQLLAAFSAQTQTTSAAKSPFRAGTLLSGLLVCGRCGARYAGSHGYYKCYSRAKGNRRYIKDPNCKNESWPIPQLDALAVSFVRQLLEDAVQEIPPEESSRFFAGQKEEEKSAEERLEQIRRQIRRLMDLYQEATIPASILSERVAALEKEQTALSGRLEKLRQQERQAANIPPKSLWDHFTQSDLDAKRLLVHSLIEAIVLDGEKVCIRWRI